MFSVGLFLLHFKMKNSLCILGFLFVVSILSCRQNTATKEAVNSSQIAYPFKATAQKFNHISAHRGGGDIAGYPENCLESIKFIDQKTDAWMEIDIRATSDDQLILMHDVSVDRTTNGFGKVGDMTFDAVRKLKLKDNNGRQTEFHPPLLEEVLNWNEADGHTVLNLDIKRGVSYEDVIELVEKTNQMDNVIAIVYSLGEALAMRRHSQEIVISLPVRNMKEWERLKESKLELKNLIAFTGTIRSEPELYDVLHDNGMLTIFGAMGNIDRQAARRGKIIYQEIFDDGADILSTDRPLEVMN